MESENKTIPEWCNIKCEKTVEEIAPGFKCIPEIDGTHSEAAIIVDYEQKQVVICGSQYSGEIKKSVFSVMNFLMLDEQADE